MRAVVAGFTVHGSLKAPGLARAGSGSRRAALARATAARRVDLRIGAGSAQDLRSPPYDEGVGAGHRSQVVVIGAGFGGIGAARRLADLPVDTTIVDRRNHH